MKYSLGDNAKRSGRADAYVWNRNYTIRAMRMPANPQTAAQTVQRGNFGSLSTSWNTVLGDADRAAWNAFEINTFDNLGHPVRISGKQAYILLNRNLFNAGVGQIFDPPTDRAPSSPVTLGLNSQVSADHFKISYTDTPIPANTSWLIFGTKTFSPGTYKPGNSQFKLLTVLPATTGSPQLLGGAYDALFGVPLVGGAIFVRAVAVSTTSGFASAGLSARTLVVA